MHKNLLTTQSSLLKTAVTAAAVDRKLNLHTWDSETVGHLVNFLYLDTYQTRKPKPLCPESEEDLEAAASDTTGTQSRVCTPDTVRSDNTVQQDGSADEIENRPLTPLCELGVSPGGERTYRSDDELAPAESESSYSTIYPTETHDYGNVLLDHVKVYALAQSLGMEVLRRMAYNRLLGIIDGLKLITPGSPLAANVVQLLRYVYAETHVAEDPMRYLITQFAVLNLPALQSTPELKELVRHNGDLAVDLMGKVCRRLVTSEDKLARSQQVSRNMSAIAEQLEFEKRNFAALKAKNDCSEKTLNDMAAIAEQLELEKRNFAVLKAKNDRSEKALKDIVAANDRMQHPGGLRSVPPRAWQQLYNDSNE